jgi:hypothetical protein
MLMSAAISLGLVVTGQIENFPGFMFYAPDATSRDVGTGPGAPSIGQPGTTRALMIVVPGSSSQSDLQAP